VVYKIQKWSVKVVVIPVEREKPDRDQHIMGRIKGCQNENTGLIFGIEHYGNENVDEVIEVFASVV
jgi:hypothetical protein